VNVAEDLAPTGTLRASINLGNPVLAQGTEAAPTGASVDVAREVAARLDVPVDRAGVRIGVKRGSAYDLFLTRTLRHATVVRGDEGVDAYRAALRRSNRPDATVAPLA
jgi:ABC-type amino acid transport substrate-binding protein